MSAMSQISGAFIVVVEDQIKPISKLRVTGLCAGNSPVTSEFPAQTVNNAG